MGGLVASRRLYDATLCLLDSKNAPRSEVRRVLERGMRHGAVSLVTDVSRVVCCVTKTDLVMASNAYQGRCPERSASSHYWILWTWSDSHR